MNKCLIGYSTLVSKWWPIVHKFEPQHYEQVAQELEEEALFTSKRFTQQQINNFIFVTVPRIKRKYSRPEHYISPFDGELK